MYTSSFKRWFSVVFVISLNCIIHESIQDEALLAPVAPAVESSSDLHPVESASSGSSGTGLPEKRWVTDSHEKDNAGDQVRQDQDDEIRTRSKYVLRRKPYNKKPRLQPQTESSQRLKSNGRRTPQQLNSAPMEYRDNKDGYAASKFKPIGLKLNEDQTDSATQDVPLWGSEETKRFPSFIFSGPENKLVPLQVSQQDKEVNDEHSSGEEVPGKSSPKDEAQAQGGLSPGKKTLFVTVIKPLQGKPGLGGFETIGTELRPFSRPENKLFPFYSSQQDKELKEEGGFGTVFRPLIPIPDAKDSSTISEEAIVFKNKFKPGAQWLDNGQSMNFFSNKPRHYDPSSKDRLEVEPQNLKMYPGVKTVMRIIISSPNKKQPLRPKVVDSESEEDQEESDSKSANQPEDRCASPADVWNGTKHTWTGLQDAETWNHSFAILGDSASDAMHSLASCTRSLWHGLTSFFGLRKRSVSEEASAADPFSDTKWTQYSEISDNEKKRSVSTQENTSPSESKSEISAAEKKRSVSTQANASPSESKSEISAAEKKRSVSTQENASPLESKSEISAAEKKRSVSTQENASPLESKSEISDSAEKKRSVSTQENASPPESQVLKSRKRRSFGSYWERLKSSITRRDQPSVALPSLSDLEDVATVQRSAEKDMRSPFDRELALMKVVVNENVAVPAKRAFDDAGDGLKQIFSRSYAAIGDFGHPFSLLINSDDSDSDVRHIRQDEAKTESKERRISGRKTKEAVDKEAEDESSKQYFERIGRKIHSFFISQH